MSSIDVQEPSPVVPAFPVKFAFWEWVLRYCPPSNALVRIHSFKLLLLAIALSVFARADLAAAPFDRAHPRFARVLSNFVANARVDYARLKEAPGDLDAYLTEVADVKPDEFSKWSKPERLALLLNLYNAQTLRLIIDHYPVASIRSIGVLPGAAWRQLIVRFGGQVMSLEHLEHEIIRAEYGEPRIHFALVCAARSCPPLRPEPFVAARLSEQLDDQARLFLATKEKNRFDTVENVLWLSAIFDWYKGDFTKSGGTLESFVKPFLPEESAAALGRATKVKVRFTDYDWALNDAAR